MHQNAPKCTIFSIFLTPPDKLTGLLDSPARGRLAAEAATPAAPSSEVRESFILANVLQIVPNTVVTRSAAHDIFGYNSVTAYFILTFGEIKKNFGRVFRCLDR